MRLKLTGFGAAFLFFFFSVVVSYAADVAKIGIVDIQKILQKSEAGKASQAKINQQGKKMEAALKKKGEELEELKKKIEREALVMSAEMREEKEREFRIKVNDFKMLEKRYKNELTQINSQLVARFRDDVIGLVKKIGKKEGYLLVIEKREGGVLYFPNAIDISDQMIQQYNAQYAKKQNDYKTD